MRTFPAFFATKGGHITQIWAVNPKWKSTGEASGKAKALLIKKKRKKGKKHMSWISPFAFLRFLA